MKNLIIISFIIATTTFTTGCASLRQHGENIKNSVEINPFDEDGMVGVESKYFMVGGSIKAICTDLIGYVKKQFESE